MLGVSMFFVYLIIALAAGVALATQSAINTQLAKAMSGEAVIATFISFAVGTIVLFFIAWVKTDLWGNLSAIPSQPWWKLIGGVLGAIVVFTTVLLAPKLGITAMLFFIIVGQLITAATIDHFGLIGMPIREVNITKFIGLIIVAFGLVFYFFGDKLVELFR
jgi:raw score 10.40